MNVGLIGCGAVVHANYAFALRGRQDYRVRWVCDLDTAQAASAADLFDAEIATAAEVAARADAVVISTPPASHAALVRLCLAPGRVVLCEKPFMTSHAEAEQVAQEAADAGTLLRVGHFRRTFPQLELAQRLVELGVLGEVTAFSASEGGRFTWRSVSDYPVRDPHGGVLWDTGSHTLDMAMFAAGLDRAVRLEVTSVDVDRDQPEPSHELTAKFELQADHRPVKGRLRVSRRQAQPNRIQVFGTRGTVSLLTEMDNRVRLTTELGSQVLCAERAYADLFECFDLQLRRVLLKQNDGAFAAERFLSQVKLLEAITNA